MAWANRKFWPCVFDDYNTKFWDFLLLQCMYSLATVQTLILAINPQLCSTPSKPFNLYNYPWNYRTIAGWKVMTTWDCWIASVSKITGTWKLPFDLASSDHRLSQCIMYELWWGHPDFLPETNKQRNKQNMLDVNLNVINVVVWNV